MRVAYDDDSHMYLLQGPGVGIWFKRCEKRGSRLVLYKSRSMEERVGYVDGVDKDKLEVGMTMVRNDLEEFDLEGNNQYQ